MSFEREEGDLSKVGYDVSTTSLSSVYANLEVRQNVSQTFHACEAKGERNASEQMRTKLFGMDG